MRHIACSQPIDLAARFVDGVDFASMMVRRETVPFTVARSDRAGARIDQIQCAGGDGPWLRAMRTRHPVSVSHQELADSWPELAAIAAPIGVRSVLSVPVSDHPCLFAALNLFSSAEAGISGDARELVAVLAEHAGRGIAACLQPAGSPHQAAELRAAMSSRVRSEQASGVVAARVGAGRSDFQSAFDHAPIGMAIATCAGHVLAVNAALQNMLGRGDELLGMTPLDIVHPDDRRTIERARTRLREHPQAGARILEIRLIRADGSEFPARLSTAHTVTGPDQPGRIILHVQDVSADRDTLERLRRHSLSDPLTGLFNRTVFLDRLENAVARHLRGGVALTVLFLDLDGFKRINDRFGHSVGDELLVVIAQRISAALRQADVAARLGGDEFVVLCEDTDATTIEHLIGRIQETVARPIDVRGEPTSITVGRRCHHAGALPRALHRSHRIGRPRDVRGQAQTAPAPIRVIKRLLPRGAG